MGRISSIRGKGKVLVANSLGTRAMILLLLAGTSVSQRVALADTDTLSFFDSSTGYNIWAIDSEWITRQVAPADAGPQFTIVKGTEDSSIVWGYDATYTSYFGYHCCGVPPLFGFDTMDIPDTFLPASWWPDNTQGVDEFSGIGPGVDSGFPSPSPEFADGAPGAGSMVLFSLAAPEASALTLLAFYLLTLLAIILVVRCHIRRDA
jgi:hypothetical protein